MAMGERAPDAEGLGGRDVGLSLEGALDDLDEVIGEMGEVSEGLMGDGLPVANGASEQMGDVGLSLVDPLGRSYMDSARSCRHATIIGPVAAASRILLEF
jgi:hypothetical protein